MHAEFGIQGVIEQDRGESSGESRIGMYKNTNHDTHSGVISYMYAIIIITPHTNRYWQRQPCPSLYRLIRILATSHSPPLRVFHLQPYHSINGPTRLTRLTRITKTRTGIEAYVRGASSFSGGFGKIDIDKMSMEVVRMTENGLPAS